MDTPPTPQQQSDSAPPEGFVEQQLLEQHVLPAPTDGVDPVGAAQTDSGAPPPPECRFDDALSYVIQVKQRLGEGSDTFKQFLAIMQDLGAKRADTPSALQRIESLLQGHPDLVLGFASFIPAEIATGAAATTNATAEVV